MKPIAVQVFAEGLLIGRAEIRPIDPPKGVYGGPFAPELGYLNVEPTIRRLMECIMDPSPDRVALTRAFLARDQLGLEARSDAGVVFHPAAVHIQDSRAWIPGATTELHLLGVPPEEAEMCFGEGATVETPYD